MRADKELRLGPAHIGILLLNIEIVHSLLTLLPLQLSLTLDLIVDILPLLDLASHTSLSLVLLPIALPIFIFASHHILLIPSLSILCPRPVVFLEVSLPLDRDSLRLFGFLLSEVVGGDLWKVVGLLVLCLFLFTDYC